MRRACVVWGGLVLSLLAGAAPAPAQARPSASAAWVQGPVAAGGTTAAFVVIENPTMYEVYVVGVSTSVAGRAEIVRAGDAATPVAELAVPAYGQVELKPGGMLIRLSALTRPLQVGDEVELTLTTDGGVTMTVSAPVRAGREGPPRSQGGGTAAAADVTTS